MVGGVGLSGVGSKPATTSGETSNSGSKIETEAGVQRGRVFGAPGYRD